MSIQTCVILGCLATVICTVLLYILVLPKSKDGNLNGFFQFLHDFFHFKKLYIEAVLRFFYVLSTMACICIGFFMMFGKIDLFYYSTYTFGYGLAILIVGPIVTRLSYELMMLTILLVKNVIELNGKVGKPSKDSVTFADADSATDKFSKSASKAAAKAQAQAQAQREAYEAQKAAKAEAERQAAEAARAEAERQAAETKEPEAQTYTYEVPMPASQEAPTSNVTLPAEPEAAAPAAKFCPSCGSKIGENAKFCTKCGMKL